MELAILILVLIGSILVVVGNLLLVLAAILRFFN
jgi:hypothetical protein